MGIKEFIRGIMDEYYTDDMIKKEKQRQKKLDKRDELKKLREKNDKRK